MRRASLDNQFKNHFNLNYPYSKSINFYLKNNCLHNANTTPNSYNFSNIILFKFIQLFTSTVRLPTPNIDFISTPIQNIQQFRSLMGEEKEPVDVSDAQNGPVTEANRECRDVFCCLLFIAAIGAMIYLTYYGYYNGDPSQIFRGVDSNNFICGDKTNAVTANYPYLYFYDPIDSTKYRFCVNSCPSYSSASNSVSVPGVAYVNASSTFTSWNVQYSSSGSVISGIPGTAGQFNGYDSYSVLSRVCIPNSGLFSTAFSSVNSTLSSALQQGDLSNFISDIKNNWMYLVAALGLAVVIGFIFMFLLRCLAGCIVWISLLGTIGVLIAVGLIFLYNAGYFGAAASAATYLGVPSFTNTGYNQIYGWICIGVGCLFIIVVLCCCSRIRLAVAICKCAGGFVSQVCLIVFVPIFQTIIAGGLWTACIVVMVYLVSTAAFVATSSSYFSYIGDYGDTGLIRFYIFVFFTLWTSAFVGAMTTFVVASACCLWYYSHGPDQQLSLPIWRSYKMVFRYHFGSLAFGSLLLAIVQFIQLLVELFKRQTQASGQSSKCFEYVIKCIQCCLACTECIVKFINTNAYIQIALRGKNFCYAAKDGFEIVWSNAMRYAIVGGIGAVIMFLGKIIIACLTAFGFYLLITFVTSIRQNYLQPLYQIILVFVIGYLVGMLFMSVYATAMDTLLQCFIVDQTNAKAKGKKAATYAPAELAELMDTE